MRWVVLLCCAGCAMPVYGSNMERLCAEAPYRAITQQHREWLRQEGVIEQRGWTITPEWLNEMCETVPGSRLSPRLVR